MTRRICLVLLAAGTLAACQNTPPPPGPLASTMVDPRTGILDPRYNDGSFSLSQVIEGKLGRALGNSDRRSIDAAFDRTLGDPPPAPPQTWGSPVSSHGGSVDLVGWQVDTRADELCGTFEHESAVEPTLAGVVTVCRSPAYAGWRLDDQVWRSVTVPRGPKKPYPPRVGGYPPPPPQTPPDCAPQPGDGQINLGGDCLAEPT